MNGDIGRVEQQTGSVFAIKISRLFALINLFGPLVGSMRTSWPSYDSGTLTMMHVWELGFKITEFAVLILSFWVCAGVGVLSERNLRVSSPPS